MMKLFLLVGAGVLVPVALSYGAFGQGVLVLDANGQPRWFYRYPRVAVSGSVLVVGAPGVDVVYLVDLGSFRVVALQR